MYVPFHNKLVIVKEWVCRTYQNLDQRVQLECDGHRIPLPSLQVNHFENSSFFESSRSPISICNYF